MTDWNAPLSVVADTTSWIHTHPLDSEHVEVRVPMTAEELLRHLIALLGKSCQRPRCREARSKAFESDRLREQLEAVTAERDALERLLTRRSA